MILPIVVVVVVAAVLAWNAWDAGRSHRALAERTVGEYADFAAAIIASNAQPELSQALFYAFQPVEMADRQEPALRVGAAELADNPQEARRCGAGEDGWFARLDLAGNDLEVQGPLPDGVAPALGRALERAARDAGSDQTLGHLFLPSLPDPTRPVAYRIRRGPDGAPTAVHALVSCFRSRSGSVFEVALEGATLLPPGLVGPGPVDSLLSVSVRSPDGAPIWDSPVSYASGHRGLHEADGRGPLRGVRVEVGLRPEVAERLVAGGVPPSRLPLALGLLAFAVLLAAGTVIQLERSVSLVRLRERFVRDVSHELRTPLQQILLYVQLLRMGKAGDEEERREALTVAERETRRLIRLVERVLTFGGGGGNDSGASTPGSDRALDLREAVAETVEAFRPVADADDVELDLEVEGDPRLRVDGEDVRRILVNLLENAVRYGPSGQTVRIRVHRSGERARISVEDQGPGIPAEERARVWEPFRRLEREVEGGVSGTGIGLAIVRELVEGMDGQVEIRDGADGGARVVVSLPAVDAAEVS